LPYTIYINITSVGFKSQGLFYNLIYLKILKNDTKGAVTLRIFYITPYRQSQIDGALFAMFFRKV